MGEKQDDELRRPPEAGWWVASDGRWYPPTSEPLIAPPQPLPPVPFAARSNDGPSTWAVVALFLAVVTLIVVALVVFGAILESAVGVEDGAAATWDRTITEQPAGPR